jgi:hypothetical protein
MQRIANINARYEAEVAQAQVRETELIAELERYRALLIPIKPGSQSAPIRRVDERAAIVECRNRCARCAIDKSPDGRRPDDRVKAQCLHDICEPAYVEALTRTYVEADVRWVTKQAAVLEPRDLESLLAFSHNQAVSRQIEDQAREIARLQAQTRERLARARQAELAASALQRDSEIASGRAAHRARIEAAAFAARDPAPIAGRPSDLCAAGDPRSMRVGVCRLELPLPDLAVAAPSDRAPVTGQ